MKILYHHRVGSKDGQFVHIDEIVRALRGLGHSVVVAGPSAYGQAEFGADAGVVASLKRVLPAALYEGLELAYGLRAFWRLWRLYRAEKPDILYERYNLFLFSGAWLNRLTGIPLLLEVNAPLAQERGAYSGLASKRLAHGIERRIWRSADAVLPVTAVLAEMLRQAGVPAERITVIQNGVGPEFLAPDISGAAVRRRHGIEGRIVLGFTGFMREWHRLDQVIDLLARRGGLDLHLLLVGDGPVLATLKRQAADLGVADRVTFTGLVPREAIVEHVAAFDIALQPHVVPYASPLKLFEYMALGRAIVAPSTPNIREVLVDGETALLFDPADPRGFQAAIERLGGDGALRRRLGDAARCAVDRQGLTWESNARRIVALGETLLNKRRSPTAAPADRPSAPTPQSSDR